VSFVVHACLGAIVKLTHYPPRGAAKGSLIRRRKLAQWRLGRNVGQAVIIQ